MKRLLSTFATLFLLVSFVHAQSEEGAIEGTIYDEEGNTVSHASVAIYDSTESNIVTGASSDSTGAFNIELDPGSYLLKITYVSYESHVEPFQISSGETLNAGEITLVRTSESLGEVFVRGERSQMEMSFDRRVFQVGQDITSLGGTAVSVLNNVPSIATDIDGNISLRGNESVRVLINGKPSSMVSGDVDALRSIPATMIKEVEIITNPSSKYAAEGSAGIINIILKKERSPGLNGSVNAGTGYPQEYEGSVNLNYRVGDVNWFFDGGMDYRTEPESGSSFQRFSGPISVNRDTSYMYRERTTADEAEIDGNIRFGADFYLSDTQVLTASTYIDLEKETNREDISYTDMEYTPGAFSGDVIARIDRNSHEESRERSVDFNLEYENKIDGDDHKLVADASFDISRENANSDIEELVRQGSGEPEFQRTEDGEEEMDLRFNLEYERPLGIGKNGKFEAGLRSDSEWMDNTYFVEDRQNGNWSPLPQYNNNFLYMENVNAAYAIFGTEFGDFSAQIGVRAENTNIRTEIQNTGSQVTDGNINTQNYIGLFPSAFLNYSFNEQQSVQVSYSRRLSRPWSRELIPFVDFEDDRSQFTGNPNLTPEYSNSYEAGYLHYWNSGSLLTSFYYRHRTDVIDDITEPRNGVQYRFPINFATEESWGVEFSMDQEIADSFTLTGNANLFRSDTDGSYQNHILSSQSENFRARMRVRWEIVNGLNYQASMRYRGPNSTPQGRREGMTMMDTGIAKDLFNGKAKVSFNVRDLMNSQNFNNTVTTDGNPQTNFYSHNEFSWSSRSFSLNFQYFFGGNQERGGNRGGGDYGSDDW